MKAAFPTAMYRRSLKLPIATAYADVLPAWNAASEEYALLLSMASSTSADVLTQADLNRKASLWLRAQGLDVGALSGHQHSGDVADQLVDIDALSDKARQGTLTSTEAIKATAHRLVQMPVHKQQRYLSDCWAVYVAEKGLKDTPKTRRAESRWSKWLAVCGDVALMKRSEASEEHIEAGLDRWVQQRQREALVLGSTIQREVSTVLAVVRLCVKRWRLGLNITAPTVRGGNTHGQRLPLNEAQQKQLMELALNEGGANGVALMLMLTTGMIASELQRLRLDRLHLDAEVPYLLVDGETKTEARKRVVPIVVQTQWLRDQIALLQRPGSDGGDAMALGLKWCSLSNPSAKLTARVRKVVPEATAYSLRHSFRLNATTHNANAVNAALLGGWTNGVNGVMLNYGSAGLTNTEALAGLAETAAVINKHLL
jgi:integrase